VTVPDELDRLALLLEALAINAEQHCCVADDLTPGQMRGTFLMYAEALRATRGYLGAIKKFVEVTT
jgi:hypothetical protein